MLKQSAIWAGIGMLALGGCSEEPAQQAAKGEPSSSASQSNEPSYEYLRQANDHAKLIALRGPKWSKADLTYVLSACWRFASGGNVSAGRATCALGYEELSLPSTGINHDTENPMASCYTATERAMFRYEIIDKDIANGTSAMDAILAYDAKASSDREVIDEEFANCKRALPGLQRDVELIREPDYQAKAAPLMAERRKREATQSLETPGSLIWPKE